LADLVDIVRGSIPAATMQFFSTGIITVIAFLSSLGAHNIWYRMLLAGIFPSK
jgi:hypothetical protein